MKKILLGVLFLFVAISISSQNYGSDIIYLNNGNIVKGKIIDYLPNISVKILSESGAVYEYKSVEIRKIENGNVIKPEESSRRKYVDYENNETGYWWSAELSGGISAFYDKSNFGLTQFSVVNGYRFNDFIRVGVGIGARYYIDNNKVRRKSNAWSFPIYADFRGNFVPQDLYRVVPYWSVDIGSSIRDGFFFSPTLGIRLGGKRSNMLIGVTYTGQTMNTKWDNSEFVSFFSLKIGYEF